MSEHQYRTASGSRAAEPVERARGPEDYEFGSNSERAQDLQQSQTGLGTYVPPEDRSADQTRERNALIDQLIDLGLGSAVVAGPDGGVADLLQTSDLAETIPAELVERIVSTGNADLLALFVGTAGWGVSNAPTSDPAGQGWEQRREGKSLTDHTEGGFGIAHYDQSKLDDILTLLRDTDVHAEVARMGFEPASDASLAPPTFDVVEAWHADYAAWEDRRDEARQRGERFGEPAPALFDGYLKGDAAWQGWAEGALADRDLQRLLIETWCAEVWGDAWVAAEADAGATDLSATELAMYYAGARNSSNRELEGARRAVQGLDQATAEGVLDAVMREHTGTGAREDYETESRSSGRSWSFETTEDFLKDPNGAVRSHDGWRVATCERARALVEAYGAKPVMDAIDTQIAP